MIHLRALHIWRRPPRSLPSIFLPVQGRIGNSTPNPHLTVNPEPTLVKHYFGLTPINHGFQLKAHLFRCSQRFDTRNSQKLHTAYNPDLADHTTHHTKPAHGPHQSTLCRMCHLYSPGLPPQCLVELQFRDRLCIDTRIVQQPIMPGFDGSAYPGHRRVHSHPHSVATRLQFCSATLHLFLHHLTGSPHRRGNTFPAQNCKAPAAHWICWIGCVHQHCSCRAATPGTAMLRR